MGNESSQRAVFLEVEGDQWFERNKDALEVKEREESFPEVDWLLSQLEPFQKTISQVLEIGCGGGGNLRYLSRKLNALGKGIDPSRKAIEWGKQFGEEELGVGSADRLNYPSKSFDLVYFGFCLYLLDREYLLSAISEADRVLRPGGFLAITDFDPPYPFKNSYQHRAGIYSFKRDYSRCFTLAGGYHVVSKRSFSHSEPHFHADPNERISTSLLFKELVDLSPKRID